MALKLTDFGTGENRAAAKETVSVPKTEGSSLMGSFNASWDKGIDAKHAGCNFLTLSLTGLTFPVGTYDNYFAINENNVYKEEVSAIEAHTYSKRVEIVIESLSSQKEQRIPVEISSSRFAFSSTATFNPQPVPEPTSAMLMLLGLAGLGLKRKRA